MESPSNRDDLVTLCRNATSCRVCFDPGAPKMLKAPIVDIAQPRWIGDGYWAASPRVVIVGINPGAGKGRHDAANRQARELIAAFRDHTRSLVDVFARQRLDTST